MKSLNFQIVNVANLAAITTPFPDHICYFTEDLENYYIWENNALKEIFVDASNISWNNITNKPTTITGFGITDAVKVNNSTLNYLAKFTPDGTTIGNSQVVDNGTNVYIDDAIVNGYAASKFYVSSADTAQILKLDMVGSTTSSPIGIELNISFNANTKAGIVSGCRITSRGSSTENRGIELLVNNPTLGKNIGVFVNAGAGAGGNYSAQLQDGTEGTAGWYLRNMTTDGKANWAKINITEVTNGLSSTLLGAPNGIATLDNNSKLVISQMPISVMEYKGTYNVITNVPNLTDGVGNQGDVYVATTSGTRTFGPGNTIDVGVGDWLIYNGTKWEKTLGNNVGSGTVNSVGITLGTTGTDVSVSNSPITTSGNINLNIPSASASARGLLTASHWSLFNDKIGGSGITNYSAKFTAGSTIAISRLYEDTNSFSIGIGASAFANTVFYVQGVAGQHTGGAFYNHSGGTSDGYGLIGTSNQTVGNNIGVSARAQGIGAAINVGLKAEAAGAGNNYSIQLIDGTQYTVGRYLRNMTTDGKANWANIQVSDVTGAVGAVNGTLNYVAKFTPNGTTIGNSQIQDNADTLSIGTTLDSNAKINISSDKVYGIYLTNSNTSGSIKSSIVGLTTGVSSGENRGIEGTASGSTTLNVGIRGTGTSAAGSKSVGGFFTASGLGAKYAIRLSDTTELPNKYLKCITVNGEANWDYIPSEAQIMCSDLTTGITASAAPKAFWHAPCNGEFTDIVFYRRSPSGTMTVEVRKVFTGALIASVTFLNGNHGANAVTTSSFSRFDAFDIIVTATSDANSKGLLATFNYNRI